MSVPKRKHVLLISFPAFGHYIPFAELAKKVHEYHDVTLAVSAFWESDIRQRDLVPPAGIRFLSVQDGLRVNLDGDLDPKSLAGSMKPIKPHYHALLQELTGKSSVRIYPEIPLIDAVIVDTSFHLPSESWKETGIPIYSLCAYPANLYRNGLDITLDTPTVPDEDFFSGQNEDVVNYRTIPESFRPMVEEFINARKYVHKMLFNSFEELEGDAMNAVSSHPQMANIPVCFVGPLLPLESSVNLDTEAMEQHVKNWLDKQEKKSTVYVSFGSIATASGAQLNEIGEALLSLGRPFIWSLRPFQQHHLPAKFLRADETDFQANALYLILPWTPQKTILSHSSTAVFVSHCGWNSTLEAVAYGIPVCAWPMFGDQHPNAALLVAKGMAKVLHSQGMKSTEVLYADKIKTCIETVAGWSGSDNADRYVQAAAELGELATSAMGPNGASTRNFAAVMTSL